MIFRFKTDEEILKKYTQEFIDLYGKEKFERLDKFFLERPDFQKYLKWSFEKSPDHNSFVHRIFLDMCEVLFQNRVKNNYIYLERAKLGFLMEQTNLKSDYKNFIIKEFVMLGVTPRHTYEEIERIKLFIEKMEKKEELTKSDILNINIELRLIELTVTEVGNLDKAVVGFDEIISKKRALHFRLYKLLFEKDPDLIDFSFKNDEEKRKKKSKKIFEILDELHEEWDFFEETATNEDGILYHYAIDAADYYTKIGQERISKMYEKDYIKIYFAIQHGNIKINDFFQRKLFNYLESEEFMRPFIFPTFLKKIPKIIIDFFIFIKNIIFNTNFKRYIFFKHFILIVLMLSIAMILFRCYELSTFGFTSSSYLNKGMSFPYLKNTHYGNDTLYYKISRLETDQWDPMSLNYEYNSAFGRTAGDYPFIFSEDINPYLVKKINRFFLLKKLEASFLSGGYAITHFNNIYFWCMLIPFLLYFHALKKITSLILDYFKLTNIYLFILIFFTTMLSLSIAIPSFLYFLYFLLGEDINSKIYNIKCFEKIFNDIYSYKNMSYLNFKNIDLFKIFKNFYVLKAKSFKFQILDFLKTHKMNQIYIQPYKNITKTNDISLRDWSGKTYLPIEGVMYGGYDGFPSDDVFVLRNKITYLNFSEPIFIYDHYNTNATFTPLKSILLQRDPLEHLNLHLNKIINGHSLSKAKFLNLENNSYKLTNYYYNSTIRIKTFYKKKYLQEHTLTDLWQKINIRYSVDFLDSIFIGKLILNIIETIYNIFNTNSEYNFVKIFREQPLELLAKPKRIFLTRLIIRTNTIFDFHLYDTDKNRYNKLFFINFIKEFYKEKFINLNINKLNFLNKRSYISFDLNTENSNIEINNKFLFEEINTRHHRFIMQHKIPGDSIILPESILQFNATFNSKMPLKRFGYNQAKQNIGIHMLDERFNMTQFIGALIYHPKDFDYSIYLKYSLKFALGLLNSKDVESINKQIIYYNDMIIYESKNPKKPKYKMYTDAEILLLRIKLFKFYEAHYEHIALIRQPKAFWYLDKLQEYDRLGILSRSIKVIPNAEKIYPEVPEKNVPRLRHFSEIIMGDRN